MTSFDLYVASMVWRQTVWFPNMVININDKDNANEEIIIMILKRMNVTFNIKAVIWILFTSRQTHFYTLNVNDGSCIRHLKNYYNDVIMGTIASQITSLTIVYSIVYSDADQRKHQSSASLAFVRGIHRGPVNSPHKWPLTRKIFSFDDVIMIAWAFQKFDGQIIELVHKELNSACSNIQ